MLERFRGYKGSFYLSFASSHVNRKGALRLKLKQKRAVSPGSGGNPDGEDRVARHGALRDRCQRAALADISCVTARLSAASPSPWPDTWREIWTTDLFQRGSGTGMRIAAASRVSMSRIYAIHMDVERGMLAL